MLSHNKKYDFRAVGLHLDFLPETDQAKNAEYDPYDSYSKINNPHGVLLLRENRAMRGQRPLLARKPAFNIYNAFTAKKFHKFIESQARRR